MFTRMKSISCRELFPGLCLSFTMAFLAGLYGPLELYFTNPDEFKFSVSVLLPELLKLFFLLFAVCALCFFLCRLVHKKLYHAALLVGLVGLVCTYIQGVYMSGALPALDGTSIPWETYVPQHIASVVLWVVVIVLAAVLTRFLKMHRMKTLMNAVSGFLTALMLVTLATLSLTGGLAPKQEAVMSKDHAFDLSRQENLLIFVIDAADSATFRTMMETTNPDFGEVLEDFTYYPDTVCAYPFTLRSIPYILSGEWDENKTDFSAATTAALDRSPLFETLRDRGYRMGLYEEDLVYESENIYQFENVRRAEYEISGFADIAKAELELVWYKYAPYPLKGLFYVDMLEFYRLLRTPEGEKVYQANNLESYRDIRDIPVEISQEPCFRFMHVEGAHVPYRYNKHVERIHTSQGTYEQNMEAAMTMVQTYLEKLKTAGVYDSSAIIIMSDHGYGYNASIPTLGRSNALLAVKGRNEHHDLQISDAPISFEDLQTAYVRLLDGKPGDQVFDARPGDRRERRFMLYEFKDSHRMWEYVQTGHASDPGSLVPTGRTFHYGD